MENTSLNDVFTPKISVPDSGNALRDSLRWLEDYIAEVSICTERASTVLSEINENYFDKTGLINDEAALTYLYKKYGILSRIISDYLYAITKMTEQAFERADTAIDEENKSRPGEKSKNKLES